jgi:hypothetical protein
MDREQLDQLITALNRLAAASEQWNRQQAEQYAEGQAQLERAMAEQDKARRHMEAQLGVMQPGIRS